MAYADLEIRILKKEDAGYPVEITFNGDQEFPQAHLSADLPAIDSTDPAGTGQRLFNWLFADPHLAISWAQACGQQSQRRIRLRIDEDNPELHALPWETLRDPASGNIAAMEATPFSRYLAGPWVPGSPILRRPIRISVAIANPENLDEFNLTPINADQEFTALQQALAGVADMEVTRLPEPITLSSIEQAVRQSAHIVHFVCHGKYDRKARFTQLFLADDKNQVKLAADTDIADMLRHQIANTDANSDDKVRMVYLSSCQTATRDSFDAFHGLAPQMVAAGIPAVIAMQDLVPVKAAGAFSTTFYKELMDHGEVDRASNAARASLLTAQIGGAAIPVLFLRLRSAQLFGQRGIILGDVSDSWWRMLAAKIRRGQCTPILGPDITSGLLPDSEELARKLAGKDYPFPDNSNLRSVTQYLGTLDNEEMRQDVLDLLTASLRRKITGSLNTISDLTAEQWTQLTQISETEIHQQLASLNLPLYLTTNVDNFMALALKARPGGNGAARRQTVEWKEAAATRPGLDSPPSATNPVVLHLFGTDQNPASMVLTEDDHLDYLARISHDREVFLPPNVNAMLAKNTLLFLGYRMENLDLKVLLRGLLTYLALDKYDRMQLAVQIETDNPNPAAKKEIVDYLQQSFRQYFSAKSDVKIYWGSARQFVSGPDEPHAGDGQWLKRMAENNPYIGPASFDEKDRAHFFGRDAEARDLSYLLIARQAVLLYAQSGAGKTSLLQAKVIPDFRDANEMHVLPIARVSGPAEGGNIYLANALLHLKLTGSTLTEALAPVIRDEPAADEPVPHLLIFDQFEEIFTFRPELSDQRRQFFEQLRDCLKTYPRLGLLLSMREDFLADMDSFSGYLPDRLRTRMRMERLSDVQAEQAIAQPAAIAGKPFDPGVARGLTDDLRRVQTTQADAHALGKYVEPVQLQIVCRQLWLKLPATAATITAKHVKTLARVDYALTGFYRDSLNAVREKLPKQSERSLRVWFGTHLITSANTRGMVYRGTTATEGLANAAVDILASKYIIRADVRPSGTWYELAHDRLLDPVVADNLEWRATYKNPVADAYERWVAAGSNLDKLLSGNLLTEASAFATKNPAEVTKQEHDFLDTSIVEDRKARRARRIKRIVASAVLIVILALAAVATWQGIVAKRNLAQVQKFVAQAMVDKGYIKSKEKPDQALAFFENALHKRCVLRTRPASGFPLC